MTSLVLDQSSIVNAALDVTRESGLDSVTMRAIAARFGVTPMALYRHVDDRDHLVRLLVDRVGAAVQPMTDRGAPWQSLVRSWATTQRTVLREHVGVAGWLIAHGPAGPEAYRLLECLLSAIAPSGLSDERVARGAVTVMSWTFSRVAIEDAAEARRRANVPSRAREFLGHSQLRNSTPGSVLDRMGSQFFAVPMDVVFEDGLTAILAGLVDEPARPATLIGGTASTSCTAHSPAS